MHNNIRQSEATFRRVSMSCHSGIKITGGNVGTSVMGDGSINVRASNVLDYSFIHLNATEKNDDLIFRCVSGLGPSGNNTNNMTGKIFFNNTSLNPSIKNNCNGFVRVTGAGNIRNFPGVYNARVCNNKYKFTTDEEGVYTCELLNSSMMYQSMSIGLYFRGRSKLQILYND